MMPVQQLNRKSVKRPLALAAALCVCTLSGCVSNVSSQVKESKKDTTGAFDGVWTAQVQKSAGRQPMPGKWIANCNGAPWNFTLRVKDGVARANVREVNEPAYVSTTGDFRFDAPLSARARGAAGADRGIALSQRTMIIYGNLQKAKGRITFAVAEFGNNGCTAIIKFNKMNA